MSLFSIQESAWGALLLLGATMLTGIVSAPALAEEAKVKSIKFDARTAFSEMHVISTDGKRWNKLKSGKVQFWGSMKLDTRWKGWIYSVGVALGNCNENTCASAPKLWFRGVGDYDWSGSNNFSFDPAIIPLSDQNGIATILDGDKILSRCNENLQSDGPTKGYSFNHTFHATLVADTIKLVIGAFNPHGGPNEFPSDIDHTKSDSFDVKVVCDPILKATTSELSADQGEFKPEDIKLFLTTFKGGGNDGPNPAATCPGLRVTTRVETSKAGGVDIRLWRQEGQGPITSEFKSAWASYDPVKNGYFADFVRSEKFDATTWLQFMAEVVGDPFAPSTPWKDITIHCTSPGGGGLNSEMPDNGDDPYFPPEKPKPQVDVNADDLAPLPPSDPDAPNASWAGEVTMADSAAAKKSCPRKGQVFFAVTRNEPGNFNYKIGCSNGQGFSGSAQSFSQGGPTFEAFGAHDIHVSRTRTVQCTLQEVKENGARVTIDKGSLDYTCNKPAVDPVVDDLTVNPRPKPTHAKPDVSILCKPGFQLIGKECKRKPVVAAPCAKNEKRISGKCVRIIIDCLKGYKLEDGKCVRKPEIVKPCAASQTLIRGNCVPKRPKVLNKVFKLDPPQKKRAINAGRALRAKGAFR